MQFFSKVTVDNGAIYYTGSLEHKNVLLILGRTNFLKDEALISLISNSFSQDNLSVMCYEHEGVVAARSIDDTCVRFLLRHAWVERMFGKQFTKNCIKGFCYFFRVSLWRYLFLSHVNPEKLIPFQTFRLRAFLKSLGSDRDVFIFARSSGGRIASLVEDEPVIKKMVCLGYPFKHPEKIQEIDRVKHLATCKKPFLIFQGERDEYGGKEILEKYELSPCISVRFVDTNHDYRVSRAVWEKIVAEVKQFIGIF